MAILSLNELKSLVKQKSDRCDAVSIFMPTFKTGADTKKNPLVLEKLLNEANRHLLKSAFNRKVEVREYLSPAIRLLNEGTVWEHPDDGLAIFMQGNFFRYYELPFDVEESAMIGYRFYIKPLIPLFGGKQQFYVLAVSQNAVRLIQYQDGTATEIDLKGIVPGRLSEALTPQKNQRNLQFHTGEPGKNRDTAVYHGQGPENLRKDNIALYFRQINDGLVQKTLRGKHSPIVFAGVEYLHAIYKQANTYANLLDKGIDGNPEEISAEGLRVRAIPLLRSYFDTAKANALKEYRELMGTGHTTCDIGRIVANSHSGQVERLLITSDSHVWGTFDEATQNAKLHDQFESCDQDLIDFAAVNTLSNSGEVYIVTPGEIPGVTSMCAVLRHEEHIPKLRHPGTAKAFL